MRFAPHLVPVRRNRTDRATLTTESSGGNFDATSHLQLDTTVRPDLQDHSLLETVAPFIQRLVQMD